MLEDIVAQQVPLVGAEVSVQPVFLRIHEWTDDGSWVQVGSHRCPKSFSPSWLTGHAL